MTKNMILATAILSSSAFGATDAQVVEYFKAQIPVPTVKVSVTSRIPIKEIKGMDYVSIDISDGDRVQKVSVFTQGDLIFPDVISVKDGSIKEKLDKQEFIKELSALYKKEDKKNILILGDDPKKETLVKFTDPECPFCVKEVEKIEEKLKDYNLKYIFTPVHDRSSLEKSILIHKQASVAKTLDEKIKILKKYFNGDVDAKVSDKEIEIAEKVKTKYFAAGLKGVPFYINEKELLE
ncbi:MAG: thioredoxin domain-containing protein [Sulfurospirillum sp.]|nr:thioredoxin domain-containing protein [Sulfurospirillum sp.]